MNHFSLLKMIGSFKSPDEVFKYYEEHNFELVPNPSTGSYDHGAVAWIDLSRPKIPVYYCYDVVLRNTIMLVYRSSPFF